MALLRQVQKAHKLVLHPAICVRWKLKWRDDWKPGPYPTTPEERAAAAKKYGLRVEDYEPYPDNGHGYGDYPNLPLVGGAARSDYEVYDYPRLKMNYGEPFPLQWDVIAEEKWSPTLVPRVPYWKQFLAFSSLVGGCLLIEYLTNDIRLHPPALPKQYAYDEMDPAKERKVKHYTFESVD